MFCCGSDFLFLMQKCTGTLVTQCFGSVGSLSFWASGIWIRNYLNGFGSFHQQAKNMKNVEFNCCVRYGTIPYLVTSLWFFIFEKLMWKLKEAKGIKGRTTPNFFVGILKATDEKSKIRMRSRIRIQCTDPWIRICLKMSRIRNNGSNRVTGEDSKPQYR